MPQTAGGLTFYEDQFATGLYQGLTQAEAIFNEASAGTLLLETGTATRGLLPRHTFFQAQTGMIQTRDPQGTGTVVPTPFGNKETINAKVFWTAPVVITAQEWEDQGLSQEVGMFVFGQNFGQGIALRHVQAAYAALVGSIQAVHAAGGGGVSVYDYSATGNLSFDVMNNGLMLAGDQRANVRAMLAHSKPLGNLVGTAFSSQAVAFQVGGLTVYNGGIPTMGLAPVITDSSAAVVAGSPTKYWTPLLFPGAVKVKTGPQRQVFSFIPGNSGATPENQQYLLSIEGSFEISVRGVKYSGAAKPNDAALATAGNWTQVTGASADMKNGPGVLLRTQ